MRDLVVANLLKDASPNQHPGQAGLIRYMLVSTTNKESGQG